jgi:hypothetical protein
VPVRDVLEGLVQGLDRALGADWSAATAEEVSAVLRVRAGVEALVARVIEGFDRSGRWADDGALSASA